jgi:FlaA1/EpsC-like NDP-sugar epimerase
MANCHPSLHATEASACILTAAKLTAFIAATVRWSHWRYTSPSDVVRIVLANSLRSLLGGTLIYFLLGQSTVPHSIYILDWLVSCLLTLGVRLAARLIVTARRADRAGDERTKVLIYGAGAAGQALVPELGQNESLMYQVKGSIDDDRRKSDLVSQGKRVFGTGETLGKVVEKHCINQVLIAIPSATGPQMVRILQLATDAKVEYKMVPSFGELLQGADLGKQIRNVAVEDLLRRQPVQLDLERIREQIQGKVVMVTGAAGSIGLEICRQIARFHPLALVGFDEAETPLFHIDRERA